mgnify:CR=1 FL=1
MADEDIYERHGVRKFPERASLASDVIKTGGKITAIEISADIPDGTAIEATVKQTFPEEADEWGNEQSIAVTDGDHTYEVTALEYGGEDVWVEFELRSEDGNTFPSVRSYRLRDKGH